VTVSANSAFELTRDGIIRRAMQLAQLLHADKQPSSGELSMAADFLNMELQALAAEGVTLYQKERTTLALVASTATYSLPADVIDVVVGPDNWAGTIVDSDNKESRVQAMPGHEYTLVADKTTTATTSTHVYIEKLSTVTVTFWPVPSETKTFRYQKVRLVRDVDTGAVTMDVARRWQKYIWLQMAAHLARAMSKPGDLVRDLRGEAKDAKQEALRSDREMTTGQLYVPRYTGGCV
jgi:hypothetical protein